MKNLALALFVLSWTCPLLAAAAQPDAAAPAKAYIRPYQLPRQFRFLEHRLRLLEEKQGLDVKDFEYSLPKDQKLLVTVRYEKDGAMDADASAVLAITNNAGSPSNNGYITITRTLDQPQGDADGRPTLTWHINVDGRYNTTIPQRLPKDYKYAASTTSKAVEGQDLNQPQVLYSVTDDGRKFALTISVQAAPMSGEDKFNEVARKPLK